MLRSAWTELIDEVFEQLVAAGFEDLRPVHRPILRDLLTSNLRPSELAGRLGLSKQAANDLVREFEAKGYITLEADPDDGRAKRIVATDRGWRASETAQEASSAVGRRWAELVGQERYAVFEAVLCEIVAANGAPERAHGSPDDRDAPASRARPASRSEEDLELSHNRHATREQEGARSPGRRAAAFSRELGEEQDRFT